MLYDMRGYMGLALSANGWSYEERWFKFGVVTGVCTLVITFVVCAVHMIPLAKTWLNVVPLVFAGLTITFSQGGRI